MMESVIREIAPDPINPWPRKHVSGLSKSERKNKKRIAKNHKRRQQEWEQRVLPVTEQANRIVEAVRENQVAVIVAETGCGKSSQVPQILLKAGLAGEGAIVCTQPRRVAAWSLAQRVAKEMGCELGGETALLLLPLQGRVGYHVRFERITSSATRISFVTDGVLLQQCLYDSRQVAKYGLVIIDEVHERSLQLDLLLGVMNREMQKRQDLKLVIMSATMNTEVFSKFFNEAPVVTITGSHHPVRVIYDPGYTVEHILSVIAKIVEDNEPGDMLVFLPGRGDIDAIAEALGVRKLRSRCRRKPAAPPALQRSKLFVVEAHSELPDPELDRIFDRAPKDHWKIILATNVAESSLTVEGLRFVVDSGFVNVKVFEGKTGVHRLVTRLISKSEAEQRKGRVGRTQPGTCYRLYREAQLSGPPAKTEEEKKKKPILQRFRDFPEPMIEREDLSQFLLIMRRYGFSNCEEFPFVTPPNQENVDAAEADLRRLGALNSAGSLTPFGQRIASFPLYPRLSAALLESAQRGCAYGMLLLASMLSAFTGGRRLMLAPLARSEQTFSGSPDEVGALMLLLDDFKDMKRSDALSRWFWETYEIKADYFYEAVSTYRQLKFQLEKYHGVVRTPDSMKCVSMDTFHAMLDVRGVLQKMFAPNSAVFSAMLRREKEFSLANGTKVAVRPQLIPEYDDCEPWFCGIDLFSVVDLRAPGSRPKVFLTPSFKPPEEAKTYLFSSCVVRPVKPAPCH